MIRVEREESSLRGKYRYFVHEYPVDGFSREPLLDACRALKRMGVDLWAPVGLFRPGRSDWDLRTTVDRGADLTVRENDRGIAFRKYIEFRTWEEAPTAPRPCVLTDGPQEPKRTSGLA
jgi:hypothetical protein